MRIFLIGFMGSGKTTVGKKLAAKLNLQFMDLDKLIESRYNKTISDIFETEGEKSFRNKETHLLEELSHADSYVLSTGGGTPCFNNNMNLINSMGISIYLKMSQSALFSRLKHSRDSRPLIKNLNNGELKKYINIKLKEREEYYENAHFIINALNVKLKNIIQLINNEKK